MFHVRWVGAALSLILAGSCDDRPTKPHQVTVTPIEQASKVSSPPGSRESPKKPSPPPGMVLLEAQPLLLVPTKLDAFELTTASVLPSKAGVGASAAYLAPRKARLVTHLLVNKADVAPDNSAPDETPMTIGTHPGVMVEDLNEKTVTIEWKANGWATVVTVAYERPVDHADAITAAKAVAPVVAANTDQYFAGAPPGHYEQKKQVDAVARAIAPAQLEEFAKRIKAADMPPNLITKVSIDGDPSEINLTVGPSWSALPKPVRKTMAEQLWKTWASVNSPEKPTASTIVLVDQRGTKVGGSGLFASSGIEVAD